jgi:uncharacterized membrane protein (DUF106 family)
VKLLNSGINGLFDLLFLPFAYLAPLWALIVFSVLTGILMLWIFGLVSDQDAIRTIRDRIRGNLIAVRLFGDDLGVLFRLQGRLLRDNAVFLKYALIPILVMIVPVLVILIQLSLRSEARPLEPGEAALVKVTLRDAAAIDRGVSLEVPAGVVVETPGVRVASLREVAWRIRPAEPGRYRLLVHAGDEAVAKELRVGGDWGATSARRTGKGFLDVLLYPGEPPVPPGAVESIDVKYRPLELELFGWPLNWLVVFFLLSILAGFAFRRVLGVEI